MESHYVDQYIKNKRRGESQQQQQQSNNSNYNNNNNFDSNNNNHNMMNYQNSSSSATTARPTTSYNTTNHYRSASGGSFNNNNNNNNRAPSISSAAQQLLSAAQRAQHEVDAVNGAATELAMQQETAERVERQHQALNDRVDTTTLQVATVNDKVASLGQLISTMKQNGADNDRKILQENSELKSKIRRLEKQMDTDREDREKQTKAMTDLIHQTVERFFEPHSQALRNEIDRNAQKNEMNSKSAKSESDQLRREIGDLRHRVEQFEPLRAEVQSFCREFADSERRESKDLLDLRLQEFRNRFEELNTKIADARAKVDIANDKIDQASQSQHELRHSLEDIRRRADPLKEWCEDKMAHLRNELRDFTLQTNEKLDADLRLKLIQTQSAAAENESAVEEIRQHIERLGVASSELAKKSSVTASRTEENIQDLRQVSDQSRDLLVQQLEATKEWASRNIMRLKKHLDLAVSDMAATRQAQLEIQTNFQRLTQAHTDEAHALREQLTRKTKEAALLTHQVDREVAEVSGMIHQWEESRRHAQSKRQAKDELRALSHMP